MATTPYKAVTWADNEPIFTSKLNAMTANDQWLFENTPRMQYQGYSGQRRAESVKIACGALAITPNGQNVLSGIQYFGTFFSTNCNPIVVSGLTHQGEVRFNWGFKGIGTTYVDSRGFEVLGGATPYGTWTAMTKRFWINWIAMGY